MKSAHRPGAVYLCRRHASVLVYLSRTYRYRHATRRSKSTRTRCERKSPRKQEKRGGSFLCGWILFDNGDTPRTRGNRASLKAGATGERRPSCCKTDATRIQEAQASESVGVLSGEGNKGCGRAKSAINSGKQPDKSCFRHDFPRRWRVTRATGFISRGRGARTSADEKSREAEVLLLSAPDIVCGGPWRALQISKSRSAR